MICITLDKDGKEAFREEKPKGWYPRNGFQRREDGNFYKQLGDPRNITDKKRAAELIKQQQEARERAEWSKIPPPLPNRTFNTSDKNKHACWIDSAFSYGLEEFKRLIKWKIYAPCGTGGSGAVEYRKARLTQCIGIVSLDKIVMWDKIEIYPQSGVVKFWCMDSGEIPDFCVRKLVK